MIVRESGTSTRAAIQALPMLTRLVTSAVLVKNIRAAPNQNSALISTICRRRWSAAESPQPGSRPVMRLPIHHAGIRSGAQCGRAERLRAKKYRTAPPQARARVSAAVSARPIAAEFQRARLESQSEWATTERDGSVRAGAKCRPRKRKATSSARRARRSADCGSG